MKIVAGGLNFLRGNDGTNYDGLLNPGETVTTIASSSSATLVLIASYDRIFAVDLVNNAFVNTGLRLDPMDIPVLCHNDSIDRFIAGGLKAGSPYLESMKKTDTTWSFYDVSAELVTMPRSACKIPAGIWIIGCNDLRVYKWDGVSVDGGLTDISANYGGPATGYHVVGMALDNDNNRLFVADRYGNFYIHDLTTDTVTTASQAGDYDWSEVYNVLFNPVSGKVIAVGKDSAGNYVIREAPTDPSTLTWTTRTSWTTPDLTAICVDPQTGDIYTAYADNTIYRTTYDWSVSSEVSSDFGSPANPAVALCPIP